ncbi:MAG TPA: putative LPS assembly protein LptD, partial [Chitinophagales bacterium]|nr:putative LPS assembly protein LptD [Chitinophagales bacterium]
MSIFLNAQSNTTPANPATSILGRKDNPSAEQSGKLEVKPGAVAVDSIQNNDSLYTAVADTISLNDTINTSDQSELQDIITYKAADSIVYDMNTKKMFLYNGSDVKYQKIKLNANLVDFDWTTMTLTAQGSVDSSGQLQGNPVFSESDKEYKSKKMKYNFKTKKGIVFEVLTKEGDAMIHASVVKKNEFDEWYGQSARYTTCDLEDHPHFYFKAKKVKIVPNKVMVSGAANLWVGDVPTPLVLPFGIFPVKQGKRSGLVLPEYGQDQVMGFFLRNGGYYWAVNDYLGLKFTGQVSTNGTVGAGVAAQYAWKYKFTG